MSFHAALKRISLASAVTLVAALASAGTASAHVTVKPGEVATATYQVFTVSVPNEKDIPTVSVRLLIPEGLEGVTPTKKAGWEIATETEDAEVRSITWSGGEITDGLRDEFTFSARTPDSPTELQWKAYQTYTDGTVVAWDEEESDDGHRHGDGDSGPFSVTNVVAEDAGASDSSATAEENALIADAQARADRALYVGIAGVVVGLIAVFLATRRQ